MEHLQLGCSGAENLTPLKGMPLKFLRVRDSKVSDLSPLEGMPLEFLDIDMTRTSDLSPLRGSPLTELVMTKTRVTDLSPLGESPLVDIRCDLNAERDATILRQIKTLKTINGKPAAETLNAPVEKKPKPDEKSTSLREWIDNTGEFKVQAELLAIEDDIARLRKANDGKVVNLPLSRLSAADQAFAKAWLARQTSD